ncbi:SKP1 component [Aphelenchoides avenae]|nr:SKP1 component [Aphelenchus avenae]
MGCFHSKTAATPTSRQVLCETSDKQLIAVDVDDLRGSGTFDRLYRELGLQENETFPGVFPVKTIDSFTFKKVIRWCKKHKDEPLRVDRDPSTQEYAWFPFIKCERHFFRVSVEEQRKLVMAAIVLDIPSLEHYGCQAIAAHTKGKQPADVRRILRQLSLDERADIRDRNPSLDPETTVHDTNTTVLDTLDIPSEVLVSIFEKLSRADLELLQLVNRRFRHVISTASELDEERGPLRRLRTVSIRQAWSSGHTIYPDGGTRIVCRDNSTLVQRLKFCAIELLSIAYKGSDELLHQLLPSKRAWQNATVHVYSFSSQEAFTFAFSDLFLCKTIRLGGCTTGFVPSSFLRLPAMVQCHELYGGHLWQWNRSHSIEVNDVVEWLEPEDWKKWREPRRLTLSGRTINGGPHKLIEALTKVFLATSRPNPYVVRIRIFGAVDVGEQHEQNETTDEEFHVRKDGTTDVLVERK